MKILQFSLHHSSLKGCKQTKTGTQEQTAALFSLGHKIECVAHSWAEAGDVAKVLQHLQSLRRQAKALQ